MPPPWGPPMTQDSSRRLSSVGTTSADFSLRPDSRDPEAAAVARPTSRQPVFQDAIAKPAHQRRLARGAAGVFVASDPARKIAGIDVLQAGRLTDRGSSEQGLRRGVVRVLHLVVLVEGGHVPGDAGREAGEEMRDVAQLFVAVIEAGNDQGDDLEPEAHLMHHPNAVHDVLELAAERAVILVAERLEVDLVEIWKGADVLEVVACGVAVGEVRRHEATRPRFLEYLNRPLGGDQGLVV